MQVASLPPELGSYVIQSGEQMQVRAVILHGLGLTPWAPAPFPF